MKKNFTINHCKDWEIAAKAETKMKTVYDLASEMGVKKEELLPYGNHIAKLDYQKILSRNSIISNPKYIVVTSINPTPLGEGKSTTTIGIVQGLSKRNKKAIGTLRQPSGGPTMNIKGSAAGGGLSQVIPLAPFSLGLTGDINAVMNAHNLGMVALTARMQHENNNNDIELALKKIKRLNIDQYNIKFNWVIDFCAQSLRNIIIGIGNKMDGIMMNSGFNIAVSSEIMSILSLSQDLKDFRKRISNIIVAYSKGGSPITTADLEVDGAMTAWMVSALNPNLMQTIEGQPILVHAGPFANISIGQSSIIADKVSARFGEYLVTESGFGADIGFEKFWNLKCKYSGLIPNTAVVVATIRSLKYHGGAPNIIPGQAIPKEYDCENISWTEIGCNNLIHHINIVKKSGLRPIICLNIFENDRKTEINIVKKIVEQNGDIFVCSNHWKKGGEGALEIADAIIEVSKESSNFKFLYREELPIRNKIEIIAKEVYGAVGVEYTQEANHKLEDIEKNEILNKFPICMVKTHLSITDNPNKKGIPKGWKLFIRDFLIYNGAKLICPISGSIKLMPGTSSNPAYRNIDVNVETGKITGLF